jgi:putative nucleotidyltransferase with HDIG domain
MMSLPIVITREQVIQRSRSLPSFPSVIADILATLDDPDGNFNVLVRAINRDPLISARVLSVANMAAMRGTRDTQVCDITTATSMIGITRLRHITLISSLSTFVSGVAYRGIPTTFWQHSVAVGLSCEELVQHLGTPVSPAMALIAGLLHDMGQFWLYHTYAQEVQACWRKAHARHVGVEVLEQEYFGIDHGTLGAWLAHYWGLPADVVAAIAAHHNPDAIPSNPLVAVVHVAEVLTNALDIASRSENRVTSLSVNACQQLGLVWDDSIRPLFGRIESRSSHANAFFSAPV